MTAILRKILFGGGIAFLFLLPFFGWIAAEPVPYRDPEGLFTLGVPEGWRAEPLTSPVRGVAIRGPAGPSGIDPAVDLIVEETGIVTLDEQWYMHLGRLRYELERVKFGKLESFEEENPPYYQANFSYVVKEQPYRALVRLVLLESRFFLLTAAAPAEEFEGYEKLFFDIYGSLERAGAE